jgi:hypothetical protein
MPRHMGLRLLLRMPYLTLGCPPFPCQLILTLATVEAWHAEEGLAGGLVLVATWAQATEDVLRGVIGWRLRVRLHGARLERGR